MHTHAAAPAAGTGAPALDGRVAVVTGGGQGIGLEIARALAAAGATLVIADRNEETGPAAAAEVGGTFVEIDVRDSDSVRRAVDAIVGRHGRIDILVNNAGIVRNTPAEETGDDEWRDILSVNCDGVFWCCREVGKVMLAAGGGSIVNIASMSGLVVNRPQPQAAYNVSKAAVIMLTKSLAAEWGARGVRVNAVAPGYVATELTLRGMETPGWEEAWLAGTPMGRVAQPSEIAPAVLYLASDAASFVTGSVLVIDGGYTAW
ncbi:MAG TPA: glucose 1-dehydrogenase [Candidatus Saccharimonadales bacterium]|nr:glucose 1-dehydrogenase [Candidatus Saccharimonadales bacterium]